MRWINPGSFLMGSPASEEGRQNREGPILSQGYWMFDTVVTQQLWQAVMDNNPSEFKGALKPVENVSWDNENNFVMQLNKELPGLELTLPTEAQWEYACRVGSKTAYHFGEKVNAKQINFYGFNIDDRGTVAVTRFPANAWGLFEMYGNVDEWCLDSLRTYTHDTETDPVGELQAGV